MKKRAERRISHAVPCLDTDRDTLKDRMKEVTERERNEYREMASALTRYT